MKRKLGLAALALIIALGQGMVVAPQAATAAEQTSEVIAGQVTAIDHERSRVTLRSSDGESHEFEASPETLKELEIGDRLEVKRRPKPD